MPAQLIRVIPAEAKDGTIQWTLCHKAPRKQEVCGEEPNYPPVNLRRNSGVHVFTVTIQDRSNLGITFSSDPLWIQAKAKPKQHVIDQNQIFDVTPGPAKLIFKDRNKDDPVLLVYQLNFVGRDQKPVKSVDPDIRNGGTTIFGDNQTALLLAGIALVMLFGAIWLSLSAMRRKARSARAQDGRSATERQSDRDTNGGRGGV